MSRQSRSRQLARERSLRNAAAAEAAQKRAREAAGLAGNTREGDKPRVFADLRGSIVPGSSIPNPGFIPNDPESLQRAYGVIDPPPLLQKANEAAGVGKDPEKDQVNTPVFAADTKPTSGMGGVDKKILRYPYEHMNGTQDYINFSVFRYERGKINNKEEKTKTAEGGELFSFGESGLTGGPVIPKDFLRSITLPIPSQIGDTNSVEYGGSNLNFLEQFGLQAANEIIDSGSVEDFFRNILNSAEGGINLFTDKNTQELVKNYFNLNAVNAFGGNITPNQLLARSQGSIINPNMELLFNNPTLRQFRFAFKFTPRFREEGEEVRKIIRSFKYHSSPKNGRGKFLKTPDIFQIKYLGERSRNHGFLNRFKLCALTNMEVNYTGDGTYATYENETPVSMIMTLSFQELTPVYAEDYEGDKGGVGY